MWPVCASSGRTNAAPEARIHQTGRTALGVNHNPLEYSYCHTISYKERYSPPKVGLSPSEGLISHTSLSVPKEVCLESNRPNHRLILSLRKTCSMSNSREAHQQDQALASMLFSDNRLLAQVTVHKSSFLALHNVCKASISRKPAASVGW